MPRPKEIFESTDKKICKTCNLPKFMDEFHHVRGGKGGRSTECSVCREEKNKITREARRLSRIGTSADRRKPTYLPSTNPDLAVLKKLGVYGNRSYL